MLAGDCREWAQRLLSRGYGQRVDLIFTSPPFPLLREKRYGNRKGDDYESWLVEVFTSLLPLLAPTGSLVIEIGNTWAKGRPAMSLTPMRSFMRLIEATQLDLCQQFVVHNPARMPGPVEWVNKRRIRVKDSFTHVWWLGNALAAKADNRRVLRPYSGSMTTLLNSGTFNSGARPSEWAVSKTGFLRDNGGAIPDNVIVASHTRSQDEYIRYCREKGLRIHPARIQVEVPSFFIRLLTEPGDVVMDPFAGSNTSGYVAETLGRRWIATELSLDYARSSLGRFRKL